MMVKNLKCTACGSPLKAKEADLVLICPSCGKPMEFIERDVDEVSLHILAPSSADKDLVYLPFWEIDADVVVSHRDSSGFGLPFGKKPMRDACRFYVCAADLTPKKTAGWNMEFTRAFPSASEVSNFRTVSHMPAVKSSKTAEKDAEFLFLKHEISLSGTLQELEYTFLVTGHALSYLPFIHHGDVFTPAV